MLKATIATALTLAAVASLSGCGGKPQDQTTPTVAPAAPAASAGPTVPADHPPTKPSAAVDVSGVAKAEGGRTVAEVYADKDALASKKVTVRGKVVKLNRGIMGKDWLHVRDGSGADGTNDLTVTTTSNPLPSVGDVVVVTGTVVLDKDFGAGYSYPVIVENAEVSIEAGGS